MWCSVLREETPLVTSRQVLQEFVLRLSDLPPAIHKELATYALEKLQPRVVAFEEQITIIREKLSALYEKEEEYKKAAQTLIGIPLDGSQRTLTPEYKAGIYIKIAQLFLNEDEHVEAERYLSKAAQLMSKVKDPILQLKYKAAFAQILDYKRKFLEACLHYYQLSQLVSEEEQLHSLESAAICAILGAAGPQRCDFHSIFSLSLFHSLILSLSLSLTHSLFHSLILSFSHYSLTLILSFSHSLTFNLIDML
jgi:COP9 signalosome complex subunit 4